MKRNAASPLRGRWRRMLGLTWLDDDDTIVPNAAKVQSPAPALDESATGVSFIWPRDTDLTREQIEVAVGDRAAAAPSPTLDAGRTVETTAQHAPRPQEWQKGPTPVLGGLMSRIDDHGSSSVFSAVPAVWGYGLTPGATVRDYAHSLTDPYEIMQRYVDDWPSMPMRSLSNDNYDRVWIAQGDHIEAMGVGDTPQEAAIEYARAVADLLRPTGGPDAFDRKTVIQGREPGERGDAGDGHEPPPDYEVWAR